MPSMLENRSAPFRAPRRRRGKLFAALAAALLSLLLAAGPAPARLYKWVDEEGNVHMTDKLDKVPPQHRPPPEATETPVEIEPAERPPVAPGWEITRPFRWDPNRWPEGGAVGEVKKPGAALSVPSPGDDAAAEPVEAAGAEAIIEEEASTGRTEAAPPPESADAAEEAAPPPVAAREKPVSAGSDAAAPLSFFERLDRRAAKLGLLYYVILGLGGLAALYFVTLILARVFSSGRRY